MCLNSPCFGTPEDINKLVLAGYKDSLGPILWIDRQWNGLWPTVSPLKTGNGCIFLTDNGLCSLHNVGLKPLEGRVAIHDNPDPKKLRRQICFTWVNQSGFDVLNMFNAETDLLDRLSVLRKAYSR